MKSPVSYKRAIEIVAKREFARKGVQEPDELKDLPSVQLIADLFEVKVGLVAKAVRNELGMRAIGDSHARLITGGQRLGRFIADLAQAQVRATKKTNADS
jgi:hypothetical protein